MMSKVVNKSIAAITIIALVLTMFAPMQASAASIKEAKHFTRGGVNQTYDQKVVTNSYSGKKAAKKVKVTSTKSTAKIKWNKSSGSKGYFVLRATSKNGKYRQIAKVSGVNKRTYTDKKLKKNKSYYYIVYPYKVKNKKIYLAKGYSKVATRTTNSTKKPDTVKGASISKSSLTLNVGSKYKLSVSYKGKPFSTWTRWSSSNKKVASVSSKGNVTAKAAGTATITAKRPSGYELK